MALPAKKAPAPQPKPDLGILAELASIEEQFNTAPATEFGTTMPDGIYQVLCANTVFARSSSRDDGSGGQPQIRFIWKVVLGNLKNREFPQFFTLRDDAANGRFKGWLKSLGYPHGSLAECAASLGAIKSDGSIFELELVTKPTTGGANAGKAFQNINFRRLVDSAADEAAVAELSEVGVDTEGVDEAEAPPTVAHNAKNAPAPRGGRRQVIDNMVDDLP